MTAALPAPEVSRDRGGVELRATAALGAARRGSHSPPPPTPPLQRCPRPRPGGVGGVAAAVRVAAVGMTTLWEALGRPPLDNPLPLGRTGVWKTARQALRSALRGLGGIGAWRSPGALWAATRGGSLPTGRTWATFAMGSLWSTPGRPSGGCKGASP
jgi:hypothetical protein